MLPICAFFQYGQKTVHDGSIPCGGCLLFINTCVKIEEIKYGSLHGIGKGLLIETVIAVFDTLFQDIEIPEAEFLLHRRKMNDGILLNRDI